MSGLRGSETAGRRQADGRPAPGRTGTDGLSHGRTGRRTAGRADSLVHGRQGGRTAVRAPRRAN